MSEYKKEWPRKWLWPMLLLCCLPALYWYNPFPLYFLNDDFIHVPLSQQAVWGQRNSIRPFGDFTLFIDALLYGKNAIGYHFTNLLLHIACSVLVYCLALKVFLFLTIVKGVKSYAAICAVLFFTYAFHAESVFWIIGRSGELGTLFFLICLLLFLSRSRSGFIYLLSFVAFICGLFSYESVWILPPVMLLFAIADSRFRTKHYWVLIAGYWLLFAVYLYLRVQWTGELTGSYEGRNFYELNLPGLGANYIALLLRSFTGPQLSAIVFTLSAAIVLLFFAVLIFYFLRKKAAGKWLMIWAAIWLLSYLPYTSLGIDTHGVEGERYLYMPSVFVCILSVVLVMNMRRRWNFLILAGWFLYNQYFLCKEADAFRVASYVAKTTMQQVRAHPQAEFYYFHNLPAETYGVPIFRLGLAEGIGWLTGDTSAAARVRILSFNKNEQFVYNGKPKVVMAPMTKEVFADPFYTSYPAGINDYNLEKGPVQIRKGKDLLIEYTTDSVYVRW